MKQEMAGMAVGGYVGLPTSNWSAQIEREMHTPGRAGQTLGSMQMGHSRRSTTPAPITRRRLLPPVLSGCDCD